MHRQMDQMDAAAAMMNELEERLRALGQDSVDGEEKLDISSELLRSDQHRERTMALLRPSSTSKLPPVLSVVSVTAVASKNSLSLFRPHNHERAPRLENKRKIRKSVHFQQPLHNVVTYIPNLDDIPVQERQSIWWEQADFEFFRASAKTTSTSVRTSNHDLVEFQLELGGYTRARHLAMTVAVDEPTMFEFSQEIPDNHFRRLLEWTNTASGRGLEHWTSKKHHAYRRHIMHKSWRTVLGQLSTDNITDKIKDPKTPQEKQSNNKIALNCQDSSRPSRILARLVGEADALSARQVYNEDLDESAVSVGTTINSEKAVTSAPEEVSTENLHRQQYELMESIVARSHRKRRHRLDRKIPLQHRGIA